MKISVGIGSEVKESAIQLSQMVGPIYMRIFLFLTYPALIERCILRNRRHPCGYFPTHEQHGSTAGLSLVMVHRLLGHCLLVLYHCLVVSTVKYDSSRATTVHFRVTSVLPTLPQSQHDPSSQLWERPSRSSCQSPRCSESFIELRYPYHASSSPSNFVVPKVMTRTGQHSNCRTIPRSSLQFSNFSLLHLILSY